MYEMYIFSCNVKTATFDSEEAIIRFLRVNDSAISFLILSTFAFQDAEANVEILEISE